MLQVERLGCDNVKSYRGLMRLFAVEFEDKAAYVDNSPKDEYVRNLLKKEHVIVLTAFQDENLVGGLVAYVLDKLEQQRSEIYIYDLAVSHLHRRQGIATSLIQSLKRMAKNMDAWVVFVQADYEDLPAVKLYESLGA